MSNPQKQQQDLPPPIPPNYTQPSNRSRQSDSDLDDEEDWDPEDWRCDICKVITANDDNPIVICDSCNVPVHTECYGSPLCVNIPEDEWICDRCAIHAQNERCALCPSTHGAMKRTTDFKWCHLACAQWIPECFYRQSDVLDVIDYLQVPAFRFNNQCNLCDEKSGAVMTCSQPGCNHAFHITCGMKENIYLNYLQNKKGVDVINALCVEHTRITQKKEKKKR